MTGTNHALIFKEIYEGFSAPLSDIDCGEKCGPHNDYGVPVCCDIQVVIPSAFDLEWEYLQPRTDLWRLWDGESAAVRQELNQEIQSGQVLIHCLGHHHCQRSFRSLTCRAFPFFPYLDKTGNFLGMAYYREYRDLCWIISNLSVVSERYKTQFKWVFEKLFNLFPDTRENYFNYSQYLRDLAVNTDEMIPILDFAGNVLEINPVADNIQEVSYRELESYGPFGIMKELFFPDEAQALSMDENEL